MEHKFSIGKFPPGNGTTFSGIPFIPENFQWNEPKSRVPFTTRPEFPEFFGKWKTPNVYMFTGGSIVRNMPQNCCVPGCKKKVYEEDGVKISFHKFPEDRELFRKWIVAIRRDVGKEFRVTDHTRV